MTYLFTNNQEVTNDIGNPLPVSKNTTVNSDSNPIFVKGTADTSFFDAVQSDAFGRLRTSDPHTVFDSSLRYNDDSRNWSIQTASGGTSTHNSNTSTISMTVGTTSGAKVVRQTKRYFQYQPGKSLLVLNTFTMQPKANVRQRVGYFDSQNGIFLEHDGTNTYIVKRSYSSGALVETKISKENWSENTLSTLDLTKSQIFWMDIEWLGVGTVRAGFVIDGQFIVCHRFHHANIITSTYMSTASLPIRYEIENTNTSASATTLTQICSSIMSEGGYTPKVSTRAISTSLTGLEMSQTDFRPLVAIRLKSTTPGAIVVPSAADIYGLQTTPFNFQILQNATITGGTWVSAGDESNVEYNITATALSNGSNLFQGMFNGGTYSVPRTLDFKGYNGSFQLRTNIDGTAETFVIAAKSTTNNDDALASLAWEEYV